jgi:hypothetical protein
MLGKKQPAPECLCRVSLSHATRFSGATLPISHPAACDKLFQYGERELFLPTFGNFGLGAAARIRRKADAADPGLQRRKSTAIRAGQRRRCLRLRHSARSANIMVDSPSAIDEFETLIEGLKQIFLAISRKAADGLLKLTNSNPSFISAWGMPNNLLVLRKRLEAAPA